MGMVICENKSFVIFNHNKNGERKKKLNLITLNKNFRMLGGRSKTEEEIRSM